MQFERAAETGLNDSEVFLLKMLKRLSESFPPESRSLGLFASANQFVHVHRFFKALQAEAPDEAGGDPVRYDQVGVARGQHNGAKIFVQTFHARNQVDVLTQRGVIDALRAAEVA